MEFKQGKYNNDGYLVKRSLNFLLYFLMKV